MSLTVLGKISPRAGNTNARSRLEELGRNLGFSFYWDPDPEDCAELDTGHMGHASVYFYLARGDGDSDLSGLWNEWNDLVRSGWRQFRPGRDESATGGDDQELPDSRLRTFLHRLCPAVGDADVSIAIF